MREARDRLPGWLRRPVAVPGRALEVEGVLGEFELDTVCRSAKCPNRGECFSKGTATFLVMGTACTRTCGFCAVDSRSPGPLDPTEPQRVALAVERMGISHVVVTSVTRDDLPDGGASHMADVVVAARARAPRASIEVLTSDFAGKKSSVDTIVETAPEVYNHNLETVPRLYPAVRPGAEYRRSLGVLARVKGRAAQTGVIPPLTKSGLMLGLGETIPEVLRVMADLRLVGCDAITVGQYLRPTPAHLPVVEFVHPSVFEHLEKEAKKMGFVAVASAPHIRSSYRAGVDRSLSGEPPS